MNPQQQLGTFGELVDFEMLVPSREIPGCQAREHGAPPREHAAPARHSLPPGMPFALEPWGYSSELSVVPAPMEPPGFRYALTPCHLQSPRDRGCHYRHLGPGGSSAPLRGEGGFPTVVGKERVTQAPQGAGGDGAGRGQEGCRGESVLVPPGGGAPEEIDTRELARHITAELKRHSIPQAIFARRVLRRSQGTLSDLLRNPKPWSKLKSGRETFRKMWKWLREPEFQRTSTLQLEACRRRENRQRWTERQCLPKKARLVFSDVQRRTLLAVFRENPRPSKQTQAAVAARLGLELSTVANFFMNSRRRSLDKWAEGVGPHPVGPVTSATTFEAAYANS
ncbi:one cut domain family member 3-like [Stegostoma tigrinum]|uniref:one cut domain family member 3-like n=1 Tax=Stegostoma tigrinum TaxID=3053191 RepID=UPI00202AF454|nr:one cut domain family member 3-like [Stegostoma tigrinum]